MTVPVLYALSPDAPLLLPFVLASLLIGLHAVPAAPKSVPESSEFRALSLGYIPLQLLLAAWAIMQAASSSIAAVFSLGVSLGVCAGVFGVLAAHDLMHSPRPFHHAVASLMLSALGYGHHGTAHVYVHHRHAATARDPSTARLGEGFYSFFARTLWSQLVDSWRFEQRRSSGIGLLRNRCCRSLLFTASLSLVLSILCGWRAIAFMALQSSTAILVLELFNYVAHYGLLRGEKERMEDRHSWNSSGAENFLLFNMGRHSPHHRAPARGYEALRPANAPELPGGYAGAILLALFPPLWRGVMDKRVRALGCFPAQLGYGAAANPIPALP